MKTQLLLVLTLVFSAMGLLQRNALAADTPKHILMIAGKPSHGPGAA